jgi:hypothetical protein
MPMTGEFGLPHRPKNQTDPLPAAGVNSRLWEIGDIVKVVEEWEAAQ